MTQFIKCVTTFPKYPEVKPIVTKHEILEIPCLDLFSPTLDDNTGVTAEVEIEYRTNLHRAFNIKTEYELEEAKFYTSFGIESNDSFLPVPLCKKTMSLWDDSDDFEFYRQFDVAIPSDPKLHIALRNISNALEIDMRQFFSVDILCSNKIPIKGYELGNTDINIGALRGLLMLDSPEICMSDVCHLVCAVNKWNGQPLYEKFYITKITKLKWFDREFIAVMKPLLTEVDIELTKYQYDITSITGIKEIFDDNWNGYKQSGNQTFDITYTWKAPKPKSFM